MNISCSFVKVSTGQSVNARGEIVDKIEYMQVRALFTAHATREGDSLGTVILGRWAERIAKTHAVIPGVQCLKWERVPAVGKPKVPGTDAYFALVDGDAVIEACVVVPWFKNETSWNRNMDSADMLIVCAERAADSNKN